MDFIRLYPALVGALAVACTASHGAIYLYLKTEGELQARLLHRMVWPAFGCFLMLYVVVSAMTLTKVPQAIANFREMPWAWGLVALNVLAVANIPRALHQGRPVYAFVSSCCTIAALAFLFAMAMFPNLVVSSISSEYNLTIYTAASSQTTLRIMRNIAFIGLPFIATYTGIIYWVFRGKTKLDTFSY